MPRPQRLCALILATLLTLPLFVASGQRVASAECRDEAASLAAPDVAAAPVLDSSTQQLDSTQESDGTHEPDSAATDREPESDSPPAVPERGSRPLTVTRAERAVEATRFDAAQLSDADEVDSLVVDCAPTGEGAVATWNLADGAPQVLSGYAASEQYDVTLPAGWSATGPGAFVADVDASEIGRDDLSLRIDLDGRPAETWSLGGSDTLELAIDADRFSSDGFQIEALTTAPIVVDDQGCVNDDTHVGRWVDIGAPVVVAPIQPVAIDVARAVAGIAPVSGLTGHEITVVLTEDDAGEAPILRTLGVLSAAVAAHGVPAGWNIDYRDRPVLSADDFDGPGGSFIVIDPFPGEPATIETWIERGRVVLALRGEPMEMADLARALIGEEQLVYLHQPLLSATEMPTVSEALPRQVFEFGDDGSDDRTVRGSGERSLVYRLDLPAGIDPEDVTLALHGTYPPLVTERGGTISVQVNGADEQIAAVADATGRFDVLHSLETSTFRPGRNFVRITADLGFGPQGCEGGTVDAWLTVGKTSGLAIRPGSAAVKPTFSARHLAWSLTNAEDFASTDVVIPDTSSSSLSQALTVIGELAMRSESGAPRLALDRDHDPSRHLVVVGNFQNRPLLDQLTSVDLNDSLGLVGAAPAAGDHGRIALVMSGGSDASIDRAIAAAFGPDIEGIDGAFALVGLDSVSAIDAPDIGETPDALAFVEDVPGPGTEDYEEWLFAQVARIQDGSRPQSEMRRMVAFGLLLTVAVVFGFGWIRRVREKNTAGADGGH